jgi:tetratricopeptide (TPR) repeat protein
VKIVQGCSAAILGAAALVAMPTAGWAMSPAQVASVAEQVSVRIDGQSPGSGVIMARQGQTYYVLTASHVVATPDEYDVVAPDGQKYRIDYSRVRKLAGVDLAVVPFTSTRTYQIARLGDSSQVKRGMEAFVAGWPAGGAAIVNPTLIFQKGIISANAQIQQGNGYGLVYTNNTLPGMSGGAVFNSQGEVIGIHGKGETDQTTSTSNPEVVVKAGFNLGVPINTFLALEPTTGLNLGLRRVQARTSGTMAADDYFARASRRYSDGDYKGAITDYNEVIRLDPTNALAFSNRGMAREYAKDPQGALSDYNQAIRLDPNSALTYSRRASLRTEAKDVQGAIADLAQAVRLDPKDGRIFVNRGNFRFDNEEWQGALEDFSQAIRLNPTLATAYVNRGNTYFRLNNFDAAISDYNTAMKINPKWDDPYFNRGTVYAKTGRFREALIDLEKAAQLAMARGDSETYQEAMRRVKALRERQ